VAPTRADRQAPPQGRSWGESGGGSRIRPGGESAVRHRKPPRRPFLLADDTPIPAPPGATSARQRRVPPDRTSRNPQDQDDSSPRFPPPSEPLPRTRTRLAPEETRSHRSLLSGQRAERVLRRAPEVADDSWDGEEWNSRDWEPDGAWEQEAGFGSADRSGD